MMLQRKIPTIKNILHSIPIGSIIALLLLLSFLVSPNIYYSNNSVYAVEEDNIESNSDNSENNNLNNSISNNSVSSYTNTSDDSDISTQANVTTASATLSIDNSANGTSYSEPGETIYRTHNVDVHVNDVTSYNLSISYGADANNTLNYEGSSKNPPTITGANNLDGNRLENNTWGYYWDTNNATDNGTLNYSTMPNYNASETILTESNSNNIAYNKTINGKLIFAAKFAEDAPYGHYKTSVLLSLAATPQNITTYSITYNCNDGSNCPENFSVESTELTYTYTVPNMTPTKEGYTFLGYSTSSGSTTVEYNPNSTISLNPSSPSRGLFAVWQQNITPTTPIKEWDKLEYMQQMTPEACSQATKATSSNYASVQKVLKDSRDDNTYIVRKLDDDRCWMVQNLRIVDKEISASDSNLADSITYSIPASSSSWQDSTNFVAKNVYYAGVAYGTYYTWCAATAGTCVDNGNASYSVCPKGWRLPTNSEYGVLLSKAGLSGSSAGVSKIQATPYDFPSAGYFAGDRLKGAGSDGKYWSSTAVGLGSSYGLYFNGITVYPGGNELQHNFGYPVRCIAK